MWPLLHLVLVLGKVLMSESAVPLIIDTDASFDVDDVVAICMAHALMDNGEVDIKAIVHDAGIPEGIGAMSVLNHYYGRDDIVLGAYKGDFGKWPGGGWVEGDYVMDLVRNYPSPVKDSSQVPDAVSAYRQVLAAAEDRSIVIAAIGFATNIADLLRSGADDHSPLSGSDLVAAKVKTVVWQGGWYPPFHGFGAHTYNWDCGSAFYDTSGCEGESSYAVNNMPASVEMVYSDIGDEIYTGGRLSECHGDDNPCRAAMIDQNGWGNGRCSWDGVVTYRAIKGSASAVHAEEAGVGGKARVEWNGANFWDDNQADNQNWLVLNGAWDENWDAVGDARWRLTDEIDSLLCQDPGHGGGPDPTQKPTENPPVGGTISNSLTGLCLAVDSDATTPADYTNVRIDRCDTGRAERWQVSENGEIKHASSGHCLDEDQHNNHEVELYSCSGAAWQKWNVVGNTIVNRDTGRCLDIQNCPDGCEAGTNVWTYDCYGGRNQEWTLNPSL